MFDDSVYTFVVDSLQIMFLVLILVQETFLYDIIRICNRLSFMVQHTSSSSFFFKIKTRGIYFNVDSILYLCRPLNISGVDSSNTT